MKKCFLGSRKQELLGFKHTVPSPKSVEDALFKLQCPQDVLFKLFDASVPKRGGQWRRAVPASRCRPELVDVWHSSNPRLQPSDILCDSLLFPPASAHR